MQISGHRSPANHSFQIIIGAVVILFKIVFCKSQSPRFHEELENKGSLVASSQCDKYITYYMLNGVDDNM